MPSNHLTGFPVAQVKKLPANAGDTGSIPGLGRSPGGRKWQPIPVFLPGESHRQRSFRGDGGRAIVHGVAKELNMT